MTYRTPIVVGDRVALAPHTDLWMAGVRFGTVTEVHTVVVTGTKKYRVLIGNTAAYWFTMDDLLGAVGSTASEREAEGATSSTGTRPCAACDLMVPDDDSHPSEWMCSNPECGIWYHVGGTEKCPRCGSEGLL